MGWVLGLFIGAQSIQLTEHKSSQLSQVLPLLASSVSFHSKDLLGVLFHRPSFSLPWKQSRNFHDKFVACLKFTVEFYLHWEKVFKFWSLYITKNNIIDISWLNCGRHQQSIRWGALWVSREFVAHFMKSSCRRIIKHYNLVYKPQHYNSSH